MSFLFNFFQTPSEALTPPPTHEDISPETPKTPRKIIPRRSKKKLFVTEKKKFKDEIEDLFEKVTNIEEEYMERIDRDMNCFCSSLQRLEKVLTVHIEPVCEDDPVSQRIRAHMGNVYEIYKRMKQVQLNSFSSPTMTKFRTFSKEVVHPNTFREYESTFNILSLRIFQETFPERIDVLRQMPLYEFVQKEIHDEEDE
jgi:hypothetical protein